MSHDSQTQHTCNVDTLNKSNKSHHSLSHHSLSHHSTSKKYKTLFARKRKTLAKEPGLPGSHGSCANTWYGRVTIWETWYGVATISGLLKIIGLFYKRAHSKTRWKTGKISTKITAVAASASSFLFLLAAAVRVCANSKEVLGYIYVDTHIHEQVHTCIHLKWGFT